jgi:hypothetical protein
MNGEDMSEQFHEFMAAEVNEILQSMDDECRRDPERLRQNAMVWIENNAAGFRNRWNASHSTMADDQNN